MTRATLLRPTLLPGLTRLWRDRHTLQLGLDPARAVLLEVANPRAVRLLDLLDGAHSERHILDHATRIRVDRDDARSLLETLRAAGLVVAAHTLLPTGLADPDRARLSDEAGALALGAGDLPGTPAQVLRRRRAARVVVTGSGRLGGPVAVALAQAGVGHVDPDLGGRVRPADLVGTGLLPGDVGRHTAEAVADAIARTAAGTVTSPVRRRRADLVVQVGVDRPAALLAAGFARRRQPHLMLSLRDGVPVIGPLVRPPAGPCLNCLDRHRLDRDPAWPGLAAQLAGDDPTPACGVATLLAAVALATAEALSHVDGGTPETVGAAVEVGGAGRFRRRVWPPHPDCGCLGVRGDPPHGPRPGRRAAAGRSGR
ncbi:TOMM precursor leader peptide-binding protein [Micromonospora sagamiensis]|uniref:Bacteriocin biosynthesis cyclodehydratase domain-containing protein n=1 Tax=Micromonospora sagamiensis TaxID=47875 RepID=A0A562WAQ8_9ACTN|nr:TOMM precursor leader peptide-binding protein [Micromonospora sagamiensis]TWJ27312.1 bacteriocin biosynthesis cyclodehydratase domain-containing protein [Micromonospora sagamiensis]